MQVGTLLLAAAGAWAQAPQDEEAFASRLGQERERIARERQVLLDGFAAEDQACRRRFFVNSCLRELAVRKREALAPLREQDIRIEEVARQRRYDEAMARRAQKQDDAERSSVPATEPSVEARERERAEREQAQAEREAQARQRAQQKAQREREAVQRQREREEDARARARPGEPAPSAPSGR